MWQAIVWGCALVGLCCHALPDVATIQAAYEREAASGSTLHDKGLRVIEAKCHDESDQFLCEVTFISNDDPAERLYFDIVAISRGRHGWQLKSGLCKR